MISLLKKQNSWKKQEVKMSSKEYKKHADIARPQYGFFSRNEWAITGTTCNNIKTLAASIIEGLSPLYKCGYADASHKNDQDELILPGKLAHGGTIEYINEINFQRVNSVVAYNPFQMRDIFSSVDLVLINGNHFEAKAQVVVIDEIKKDSLKKRLHQLTNVQLILLADNSDEVFDFITQALPNWQQLPLFRINDTDKIIKFFKEELIDSKPILNGLVLAGGKSVRMGYDKSNVNWHGKEQKYFIADLLKNICHDVFISCRDGQQQEIVPGYKTIADTFIGLGPYGAILSAFREQPDAAWMVIACDLPLLDIRTLEYLKDNRKLTSMATTFKSPHDGLPEPLITIWEPRSYPVLLRFLSQGFSCPRKVLTNNHNVEILNSPEPNALKNVNTPADMEDAKKLLNNKMVAQNGS
jgi:molybdenum cofactor guanylyltransferase